MITERRRAEIVRQELLRLLLNGNIYSADQLSSRVAKLFSALNYTFFEYQPVGKKSVFPVEQYNDDMNAIELDIATLYDEIYDLLQQSLSKLSFSEITYAQYKNYTKKTQNILKALVALTDDLEDNFATVFDDFVDISKTDLSVTTNGIIDLQEQALVLPYQENGIRKLSTTGILNSSGLVTISQDKGKGQTIPGMDITNLFMDSVSAWAYEVSSDSPDGASITIQFPINGKDLGSSLITRFVLVPYLPGECNIYIYNSDDKQNWSGFPGHPGIFTKTMGNVPIAIDFEETYVKYIRIVISKATPDKIINDSEYVYLFGIKNLSWFSTGRINYALYQSKPFTVSEDISSVGLESDDIMPDGTTISYYIALGKDDSPLTSFLPIAPPNRTKTLGISSVLEFSAKLRQFSRFSQTESTLHETYKGIGLYKLGRLTTTPIYGSCELYRGFQGWKLSTETAKKQDQITNAFVSFSTNNTQYLYVSTTEVPVIDAIPGATKVSLKLSHTLLQPEGWKLTPSTENITTTLNLPQYSIARVLQKHATETQSYTVSYGGFSVSNPPAISFFSGTTPLIKLNIILTGDNKPVLSQVNANGHVLQTFLEGIDYILDTDTIDGRTAFAGTITVPANSAILAAITAASPNNISLKFTSTLAEDVTFKVTQASGNVIVLDGVLFSSGDSFEITYKYCPLPPNKIIKSTVRVKATLVASAADYYVEGKDYVVHIDTGTIERVPTGDIPTSGEVFVDFSIDKTLSGMVQYSTWVFQPESYAKKIRVLTALTPDTRVGEAFFLLRANGVVELTNATEWPELAPGWHQFLVNTKSPASSMGTCLLHQVQNLITDNNYPIFTHDGNVFSQMVADRAPLTQIPYARLKKGTLKKDTGYFALTENLDLIINYQPGTLEDILYIKKGTVAIPLVEYERFDLYYQTVAEGPITSNQIFVRCVLQGSQSLQPSVTPKVYRYLVRVL